MGSTDPQAEHRSFLASLLLIDDGDPPRRTGGTGSSGLGTRTAETGRP